MAVVLDNIQRDRDTLARSPPGTSAGGSLQIPSYGRKLQTRILARNRAHLETGRAPVDELDCPLRLDVGNSSVDVLGDDVSTVEQAAGPDGSIFAGDIAGQNLHVLAGPGVTLDQLVVALE